jgi:hypothetical protein
MTASPEKSMRLLMPSVITVSSVSLESMKALRIDWGLSEKIIIN